MIKLSQKFTCLQLHDITSRADRHRHLKRVPVEVHQMTLPASQPVELTGGSVVIRRFLREDGAVRGVRLPVHAAQRVGGEAREIVDERLRLVLRVLDAYAFNCTRPVDLNVDDSNYRQRYAALF